MNIKPLLEAAVHDLPKDALQYLVLDLGERDMQLDFQLTARLVPMSMDETVAFLHHAIDCTMQGRRTMGAGVQERIALITDALMIRANGLLQRQDPLGAAAVTFSILVAIEPKMSEVSDEGFTFSQVVTEAFQFLADLPNHGVTTEQSTELSRTAQMLLNGISESDRFYEDDWNNIIASFQR